MLPIKRILCIDDDADVVCLVKDTLESQGFEFIWAFNGREGLDLAFSSSTPPDLIMIDIRLPDISSAEVARQIRASTNDHLKNVPIIALCDSHNELEIEGMLKMGCNMVIIKPIDIRVLIMQINVFFPNLEEDGDELTGNDLMRDDSV